MLFKEHAVEEFKRSPIAVITAVVGVFVASMGLLIAWLAYSGPVALVASSSVVSPPANFHLTNLLLGLSFFLASSLSLALLIHILERKHPFHAMILSIPAAVISAFLSLLVLQLAPPRPLTDQTLALAQDAVFWATLFVFLAMNGRSAALDVFDQKLSSKPESGGDDSVDGTRESGGKLLILFLQLLIWGALVSAGLSKLVDLFLR